MDAGMDLHDVTGAAGIRPLELTSLRDVVDEAPAPASASGGLVALTVALGAAVLAVWAAVLDTSATVGPGRIELAVVVIAWAATGAFVARQRPDEPLGLLIGVGSLAGGVALLGASVTGRVGILDSTRDIAAAARALGLCGVFGVALHATLGLPDGRLGSRARRVSVVVGYAAALAAAVVLVVDRPEFRLGPVIALAAFDVVVGIVGFVGRCQRATVAQRPRLQWCVWGALVALAVVAVTAALAALVDWPDRVFAVCVAGTLAVPLAVALGAMRRQPVRIDRLLVHTVVLVGLVALVAAIYLLVLLGLGRRPEGDEQTLLGLSMLAAAVAALAWVPARDRLTDLATRRVYGERHAPDEVLRTFGSRLTRALPLDELLLQLAESLKKTMSLDVAEVWTRNAGRLERAVSVPDRGPARLDVGTEEELVVARAGVSGPAWARVWMPALVGDAADPVMRLAPVTNSGELLGMIVVRRPDGAIPFDEDDDQALTELARQVGLALHNVKLDSALQESLDEVRRQADELRASRARIVEATDAERRRIERDLHDGAQQHLVALAVSVRLTRQIADADPDAAKEMLDQIGADLQEAVQELRNLAHGIYPPLLMDRGLGDALRAAGNRAVHPVEVVVDDDLGRYPQPVEAAVYFCCLEALQNAGKHAGDGATITVTLGEDEGALLFEVRDDGAGFAMASGAQRGHGFVNMAVRVGAFGGTLRVESAPGEGTTVAGRVPLPAT
jgi:signal transduction histidine kinase